MSTVTRSVRVRRPIDEVAKVATDPEVVLPIVGVFGRFSFISQDPDGSQEWDLYLDVGTIHVGGRVRVEPRSEHTLTWRAIRGKQHTACIEVSPAGGATLVTASITITFGGLLAAWATDILARGILGRHLEAGLERLRHHIEYGDA